MSSTPDRAEIIAKLLRPLLILMLRGVTRKPVPEDLFRTILQEIGVDTSKFRLHLLLNQLSNLGDEVSKQDSDYTLDNAADRVVRASLQLAEARLSRNKTAVAKAESKHREALNEYAARFAARQPNEFERRVDEARRPRNLTEPDDEGN